MRVVTKANGDVVTAFPQKVYNSLGAAGFFLFGENAFGHTVDFFNPASDVHDIYNYAQVPLNRMTEIVVVELELEVCFSMKVAF